MTELYSLWMWMVDGVHGLLDFMVSGGVVMWALLVLCVLYWTLMFERLWFMRRVFPRWTARYCETWTALDHSSGSWPRTVRALWLNEARQQLLTPLRFGKALVAMYPLLGLLGTVTGMIAVFDVLAINGNGDPRGMAAGVWKATIPTMAGMVLAISGLFSLARLERLANLALERLADQLRND